MLESSGFDLAADGDHQGFAVSDHPSHAFDPPFHALNQRLDDKN
jgi:hypothetical protein